MRKLLFALTAATLFLTACQKEVSTENGNGNTGGGGGGTTDSLLSRLVYVAGADSVANDFSYDASRRLVKSTMTSTSAGGNQEFRIYRNASGIMNRYTVLGDQLSGLGIDSLVTIVAYNSSKSQYAYSTSTFNLGGVDISDSTAFNYNTGKQLTEKVSYAKASPTQYVAYAKTEYTYNGDNIASEKYYTFDATSGQWTLEFSYSYTFDSKINPMNFGAEGLIALSDFIYASAPYGSANNATKSDYVDATDPTNNISYQTTYTYNSSNKPSSGTATVLPGPGGYALRFYYK